ncbi:MAG: hypothetical protein Q9223_003431 [Gallowayella weberi]
MALHGSDSSGDEDVEYSTTNVVLGYATTLPTDDTFSHLGGVPSWPDDEPPSASLAKCKTCNSMMALLLQLNGDLPEYFPGHERKLYIFACRNKPCRRKSGAVRAIRSSKISPSPSKHTTQQKQPVAQTSSPEPGQQLFNLGDSIFKSASNTESNTNINPFSTPTSSNLHPNPFSSTKTTNPIPHSHQKQHVNSLSSPPKPHDSSLHETFAQKARLTSPPPSSHSPREPWPSPSVVPQPYHSYYLDADYETLDAPEPKDKASSSTHNIPFPPTSSNKDLPATDEDDDPANWLSGPAKADKTFLRFAARLAQNPEQVLRYEWCGQPLLYSKDDEVGLAFPPPANTTSSAKSTLENRIPNCRNCGSRRVFELQLTPHAISELEREEEGLEGMEWGTVVVGSCEKSCGEKSVKDGAVGWVEEWVGVSWEESVKGR